jgi:hypothetical protein
MFKAILIVLLALGFYGCNKCQECYVVEYETDGVTVKQETDLGEYCGADARKDAEAKAIADGISCSICQVKCK